MYILGDPFLRTFPTTFDYKRNKMELGISIYATDATINTVLTGWAKFFIVIACLFVVSLLTLYVYRKHRRNELPWQGSSETQTSSVTANWPTSR